MAQHSKHPPLKRPSLGFYARAEFALVGTTCDRMDGLLVTWQQALAAFQVLTVTGDHGSPNEVAFSQFGGKQFSGGPTRWNDYDDRLRGRHADLALVNGNHYPAARQIVFVDPKKAGTLERRQEQLTDVAAIVMCPGAEALPGFLSGARPQVQCTLEEAGEALLLLLTAAATEARPVLKALVLAGGKSTRMGTDKSQLVYRNGQTELERNVAMCGELGLETFVSVATADADLSTTADGLIPDRFLGLGPLGAIASAFLSDPDAAWLVLACDLPLLEIGTLKALIAARNSAQTATAVRAADQPFPEPLIAIYEPRAYPRLLEFLSLGYACPRKVLINSDVAELVLEDTGPLTNANTQEERERVLTKLND